MALQHMGDCGHNFTVTYADAGMLLLDNFWQSKNMVV